MKNRKFHQKTILGSFRTYGLAGLLLIILAEVLLFLKVEFFTIFFTPIVWTGYILLVDAFLFKLKGSSLITHRTREFLFMLPWSVICWFIFEAYNLKMNNWYYLGLPEPLVVRVIGYVWSFATIFPGILLTSELLDALRIFSKVRVPPMKIGPKVLHSWMMVGAVFLIVPPLFPARIAAYLIAPVWLGFVFLLDPWNGLLDEHSLFLDLRQGKIDKLLSLFLAGLICGLLWEFWNYWATTKWVYNLPYLRNPRIFEMPLAGFLGFLPFAVECYALQTWGWHIFKKCMKAYPLPDTRN
ncbi:MAG: hypothetical protein ONB05_00040 [candidate division KSB1 bacterium]|nr:hypothetical protein [candidate division KSB1 bacterium]